MQTAIVPARNFCILCAFGVAARAFSTSPVVARRGVGASRRRRNELYAPHDPFAAERGHNLKDDSVEQTEPRSRIHRKGRSFNDDDDVGANTSTRTRRSRRSISRTNRPRELEQHRETSGIRSAANKKFGAGTAQQRGGSGGPQSQSWALSLKAALQAMRRRLDRDAFLTTLRHNKLQRKKDFDMYMRNVQALALINPSNYLIAHIFNAMRTNVREALDSALATGFYHRIATQKLSEKEIAKQKQLTDLMQPAKWYPGARKMNRKIHVHVGPTNSGKTYQALQRLQQAETGVYASPLRLLAHEIFMRFNGQGRRCNLVTGDDRRLEGDNPSDRMLSCTVEMVPLNTRFDVAVIDEIQMLAHEERGWAWTQVLLGVQASEVHVCGEERAVPMIRKLAALCGDELEIHRYKRLSPLKTMSESLDGDVMRLKKGDCVVCFSVIMLHALRQKIEKSLNVKVAIIYGALPPETRAQQASLFNDPNNEYDILVASDAVGMGLNLSIKRMIFHSSMKGPRQERVPLLKHEIKQIGGRAGRFSSAHQHIAKTELAVDRNSDTTATSPVPVTAQTGLVTSLDEFDYPQILAGMEIENDPITTVGIFPMDETILDVAKLFPPDTPFSVLLLQIFEIAKTTPPFMLSEPKDWLRTADIIHSVDGLTTEERITFCAAPSHTKEKDGRDLLRAFAEFVAKRESITIHDVVQLDLGLLKDNHTADRRYLLSLEMLHKGIVLYLWLSYRFDLTFSNRKLATEVKEQVEERIAATLDGMSFDYDEMRQRHQKSMDAIHNRGFEINMAPAPLVVKHAVF